jgi:hypothetical protein
MIAIDGHQSSQSQGIEFFRIAFLDKYVPPKKPQELKLKEI